MSPAENAAMRRSPPRGETLGRPGVFPSASRSPLLPWARRRWRASRPSAFSRCRSYAGAAAARSGATAAPARAALLGYAWGLGFFLAGVSWIYVSLHDFGGMAAAAGGAGDAAVLRHAGGLSGAAGYGFARLRSGTRRPRRPARRRPLDARPNGCAAGCSPASPGSSSATRRRRRARWPASRRCSASMASA